MAKKAVTPKKPLTKTEILNALAEETELSKKDVAAVFNALGTLLGQELGKKALV